MHGKSAAGRTIWRAGPAIVCNTHMKRATVGKEEEKGRGRPSIPPSLVFQRPSWRSPLILRRHRADSTGILSDRGEHKQHVCFLCFLQPPCAARIFL